MAAPPGAVMLVLRWGPWLRTAVSLAAGIAAGVLLPWSTSGLLARVLWAATLGASLAIGVGTLGPAILRPGPARERPSSVTRRRLRLGGALLAQLFVLWTGAEMGRASRHRALRACPAALISGDSIRVTGRSGGWGRYRSASGALRARLRLEDARITARRGTCEAGRLLVLLSSPPEVRPRGRVTVDGRWWRYPGPRHRPRLPGRYGLVRADGAPRAAPGASKAGSDARPRRGVVPALRGRASSRLEARLPPDVAPLGAALLLAERDGLPPAVRDRFAEAGLAHVLAVSGLHVGVLGALGLGLLGILAPTDRRRYPASAILTLAYVAWIGAPASATRAALVYAGWAFSRYRGSPVSVLELVGAAALLAMLDEPLILLDAGFQLSFSGFVGLLVGGRAARVVFRRDRDGRASGGGRRPGRLRRRERAAGVIGAAAGAFLATAPLVAVHFGRVAPVAVASGLAGAPAVGGALPALAAAASLPDPLGQAAGHVAAGLLRLLMRLAEWFADVPGGHGAVAPPGPAGWAAVLLGGWAVVRLAASGRAMRSALPAAAAIAVVLAWPAAARWAGGDGARLCVLDVGQGDAVAVRTGQGRWMLVDAGPGPPASDAGLEVVVPHLRRAGAARIEVLVLTHPHLDHVGGAASVLDAFPVREIWDAATVTASDAYRELLDEAERRGVLWRAVGAGDRFRVDDVTGLVLAPPVRSAPGTVAGTPGGPILESPRPARDPNESSVVLRLAVPGGGTALLAGDAGPGEEAWMETHWIADSLRADVLKVAHHGSRSSTTASWLAAVRPGVALISAGEGNRYGHPHSAVLQRLESLGVEAVYRTDRHGTVCLDPAARARLPRAAGSH